jgi:hypothetical protein
MATANFANSALASALQALTPAERDIVTAAIIEGAALPEDAKAILRWLKRKLKRGARAGKRRRRV